MGNLKLLQNYFGQDLGAFYRHAANRQMLYPFIFSFFLVECASFWFIYLGPAFVMEYMAFTTVYSLHKAAVYALCIFGADALAHRLAPARCSYGLRTVGLQWIIWSIGFAIGFVLQRTMVKSLIALYAPDAIMFFAANPQLRLSAFSLLLILIPYWGVVAFLTLQVAKSRQRLQGRALARGNPAKPSDNAAQTDVDRDASLPSGRLCMDGVKGFGVLALADVTHVSVEDHYCRVNYSTGNGLKSKLVRLPLKEMLKKLPREHFLRIHRSHVVNVKYATRLAKSGRDHKLVLQHCNVKLPISRSRFKDLRSRLKQARRTKHETLN